MDISDKLPYYAACYDEIIWTTVHIVHYNPIVQVTLDLGKKALLLGVFLFMLQRDDARSSYSQEHL